MTEPSRRDPVATPADAVLRTAENLVYAAVGVLLLAGAALMLVSVGYHVARDLGDGVESTVTAALNGLLLVFILLELLAGVRATMVERKLVAEPFLIVGIIASIKEIVVLSVKAAESIGSGTPFRDQLWQIGVLGVVVVLLGVTAWLLRRKEREPDEGAHRT